MPCVIAASVGDIKLIFAQSSEMGFDARPVNRPFLVFEFRALWRSTLSAWNSKPKNGRLACLALNPWIIVAVLGTLS